MSHYTSSSFRSYIDLYVESNHFLFKIYVTLFASLEAEHNEHKNKNTCSIFLPHPPSLTIYTIFLKNGTASSSLLKLKHHLLRDLFLYFYRGSRLAMERNGGKPSFGSCWCIWMLQIFRGSCRCLKTVKNHT